MSRSLADLVEVVLPRQPAIRIRVAALAFRPADDGAQLRAPPGGRQLKHRTQRFFTRFLPRSVLLGEHSLVARLHPGAHGESGAVVTAHQPQAGEAGEFLISEVGNVFAELAHNVGYCPHFLCKNTLVVHTVHLRPLDRLKDISLSEEPGDDGPGRGDARFPNAHPETLLAASHNGPPRQPLLVNRGEHRQEHDRGSGHGVDIDRFRPMLITTRGQDSSNMFQIF